MNRSREPRPCVVCGEATRLHYTLRAGGKLVRVFLCQPHGLGGLEMVNPKIPIPSG